jgi:hypothetical protein
MDERLGVNTVRFAHETIDGETILIDSETGHMLLLTNVASVLWGHLIGGASLDALVGEVESRFGAESADATRRFLDELRKADILVPTLGDAEPDSCASLPWPRNFTSPVLERYDDIANIIAMDPIHDVSPAGWPRSGS